MSRSASFVYPVTPHLVGSAGTPDDSFVDAPHTARVLQDCTLVQPKLDGINVGARYSDGDLEFVLKDRPPTPLELERLRPLARALHGRLASLVERGRRLQIFGELSPQSHPSPNSWTVFDVFDEDLGQLQHYRVVSGVAAVLGVPAIPVMHWGPLTSVGHLVDVLTRTPEPLEGCVIRIQQPRGGIERYKFVRSGFQKTMWSVI